ncbi:hypothetical protein EDB80DRAFT_756448 [Ilyonectria destructans]|nr:hypothetical protein EDB80DRAFT_756448 [Ilyonectria destructans]
MAETLAAFAEGNKSIPTRQRRPLAKPNEPIDGSIGKRKMDVGFGNDPEARKDSRCHWSQILVRGEHKSNPSADKASEAWLDLGRYAREVLAAQDTRRFVLGFAICQYLMRVWVFDRPGGIASEQFDINEDGLQFVFTILGLPWMNEEQIGFDPTIMTANKERFIEVMQRAFCMAGRATTCWKAHLEGRPEMSLVIKDSWQYLEREEEGKLRQEATEKGVVNVARHDYHETVQIGGIKDDVRINVRKGLDITKATNYRPGRSVLPSSKSAAGVPRNGRSSSAGVKRSKRSCSASPMKASSDALPNRIHRRVVLRDSGKPIYKASSRTALLAALEGCIKRHKSLPEAGLLHRDISINNLMINEDDNNPSWPSFLIDPDLAIKEQREGVSGARGKTDTRAFMAIGTLLGEQHSFMHGLESLFWVLFWICIHYNEHGKDTEPTEFESWNYEDGRKLACSKLGTVGDESMFLDIARENFSAFHQPLIPCINRLRKVVFPNGERWKKEDSDLYFKMK